MINYLSTQQISEKETIEKVLKYYYDMLSDYPTALKNIIDNNNKHKEIIMIEALKNNDLYALKLITNENELLSILNYVLSLPEIFSHRTVEEILNHYYTNKINLPIIIETLINTKIRYYNDIIMSKSLLFSDLNTLKLFINNENADDLLIRAIKISNIEISTYIMNNFKYNKYIITDLLQNRNEHPYLNQKMIDTLAIIAFNETPNK